MKLFLPLIVFMLSFFPSEENIRTTYIEDEKMPWSASRPLKWSDFRGTPEPYAGYVATTNSGISFTYSFSQRGEKRNMTFEVNSYFYPNSSWYVKGVVTPYILKHEQTHFDISELFARKLKKKLEAATFTENLKSEVEAIYRSNEISRRAMQDDFDLESDHSKNKAGEAKWEAFVAAQLKAYERWQ